MLLYASSSREFSLNWQCWQHVQLVVSLLKMLKDVNPWEAPFPQKASLWQLQSIHCWAHRICIFFIQIFKFHEKTQNPQFWSALHFFSGMQSSFSSISNILDIGSRRNNHINWEIIMNSSKWLHLSPAGFHLYFSHNIWDGHWAKTYLLISCLSMRVLPGKCVYFSTITGT